jgi:hypothetical protein
MLLATPIGIKALATWPQYGSSLEDAAAASKGHIHVSVFQYFCYWFAFYAIKGGDLGSNDPITLGGGSLGGSLGGGSGFGSSVRRAADALHLTRGRDADPALANPYIALLRQMSIELVPRPVGVAAPSPLASPRRGGPSASGAPSSPYYTRNNVSGKRGSDAASRGLIFYSTLLEFWLKDADEPVPTASMSAAAGGRGGSSVSPLWATTYEPPSEDLLEALGELIRYVTVAPSGSSKSLAATPAQGGGSWLPVTPVLSIQTSVGGGSNAHHQPGGASHLAGGLGGSRVGPGGGSVDSPLMGPPRLGAAAQPGSQALSRQLYRFFHRAFSMWPDQRTMKPLLRAFIAFIAPWQSAVPINAGDSAASGALASQLVSGLVHRVSRADGGGGGGLGGGMGGALGAGVGGLIGSGAGGSSANRNAVYTPEWEAHVLSNIPFYLELLPLFLERSISRVSIRGETAVQDVLRVLGILESSSALVDLLRAVERDVNRCAASQPRRAEGPYAELLPWLIEQAQDWQVAATANAVGDIPASGRQIMSYAMFAASGDRCASLAAKDLLDLSAGMLKPEAQQRLKKCLERVLPLAELAEVTPAAAGNAAAARLMDSVPRLPRSTWRDVRFKGDSLERPVTTYEIAPLVRIAVAISQRINAALGLDQAWDEGEEPPENQFQEILVKLRQKEKKVDLRPLGDIRNLFWFPVVYWTISVLLRAIWVIFVAIFTGMSEIEHN